MASFFEIYVSDVFNEVVNRGKLAKFLKIGNLESLNQIRELYSRSEAEKYLEWTLNPLNKL